MSVEATEYSKYVVLPELTTSIESAMSVLWTVSHRLALWATQVSFMFQNPVSSCGLTGRSTSGPSWSGPSWGGPSWGGPSWSGPASSPL